MQALNKKKLFLISYAKLLAQFKTYFFARIYLTMKSDF